MTLAWLAAIGERVRSFAANVGLIKKSSGGRRISVKSAIRAETVRPELCADCTVLAVSEKLREGQGSAAAQGLHGEHAKRHAQALGFGVSDRWDMDGSCTCRQILQEDSDPGSNQCADDDAPDQTAAQSASRGVPDRSFGSLVSLLKIFGHEAVRNKGGEYKRFQRALMPSCKRLETCVPIPLQRTGLTE